MSQNNTTTVNRSGTLNTINALGSFFKKVGIDPFQLNTDHIIAKAKKKAAFKEELSPELYNGIQALIHSVNTEAKLNTFGALAAKTLYERTLYGRLKVEQVLSEQPDILKSQIQEPVFIIGMPRTGTTILHAMLNEDRDHRSPLCWECLIPDPVPIPETYTDNAQLNKIRKEFDQLFKLVPDFKRKHHMEADSPQECIGINALDFNTFQVMATMYLPSYTDWFHNEADKLQTMNFHKRFLQYLQSGGVGGKRWLLKSPVHLMRLPELFQVYPDAKVIVTHREPTKIVPSAASLISSVRSLYSDHEDMNRTGAEQADIWSMYFEQSLKDRKRLNKENQILDIRFDDFVVNQVGTIERIYKNFGWSFSEETKTKLESFLNLYPKDKHGSHKYSLEAFNLNEESLNRQFTQYNEFLKTLPSHEV